jgi:hypothetical protein
MSESGYELISSDRKRRGSRCQLRVFVTVCSWRLKKTGSGGGEDVGKGVSSFFARGAEEGMEADDLLCSRNARPQKALVGRAQWKLNPPPSLKRSRASSEELPITLLDSRSRQIWFSPCVARLACPAQPVSHHR